MGMLLLVAATVLVLAGAAAATALLRPDSRLDAAITAGVVATAAIALAVGVPGALGHLGRVPVLATAGVGSMAAIAGLARRDGLPVRRWSDAAAASIRRAPRALRHEPWTASLVGLAAAAFAWQALFAVALPVYAYDALTYHLTTVATWLQQGSLREVELSGCCAHYALTAELMHAWPMLLVGSEAVVNTVQLGFAVLGALAVAGIVGSAGLSRAAATAAAALFLVIPVVLTQAPTPYVDVMLAAWSLAGLHSIVRFVVTNDVRRLVPAGVATGLLLGTKGTGVVWAVVFVVLIAGLLADARRRHRLSTRAAAGSMALVLVACLSLGSFWYVRNWVTTGNPLHPFRVEVAGRLLFDGPTDVGATEADEAGSDRPWPFLVARSWAADLDFWEQEPYDYEQRRGGLGPVWAWLGAPLVVPVALVLVRRRNPAALAMLTTATVFALQPYRWWSRFTISLAAMGVVAIAVTAWSHRPLVRRAVRLAVIPLALGGIVLASVEIDPAARARPLGLRDLVRVLGEPRGERTVGRLFLPEYRFVDEMPDDAAVVVDLDAEAVRFVYPLIGSTHRRRVVPAGPETPLAGAWVVTAGGRPLDRRVDTAGEHDLVSDRRGLRAWRPLP